MEISKIGSINFKCNHNNDSDSKVIQLDFTQKTVDATSQDALDSIGRAQVLEMPKPKRKIENIEQSCNYMIEKYRAILEKTTSEFSKESYEKKIKILEELKQLNNDKYFRMMTPKRISQMIIPLSVLAPKEGYSKNIEILNGMDDRIVAKLKSYCFDVILKSGVLEERIASLSCCDDAILENLDSGYVMDYLANTNVFSKNTHLEFALVNNYFILSEKEKRALSPDGDIPDYDTLKRYFDLTKEGRELEFKKPIQE